MAEQTAQTEERAVELKRGRGRPKGSSKPPPKWGEVRDGKRCYPLHKFQNAVLNSKSRTTFAFSGTGGGKTSLIPLWLAKQLQWNDGKGRYLIVSPTYKTFKQSRLLDAWGEVVQDTPFQGRHHKTDNIYTAATGAEIFFRSADDPNSLEGGQYHALGLDEVAKISQDAWVKASARVGISQGPILGVSTPDLNNWCYDLIFKQADTGHKELFDDGAIRTSQDGSITVVQWASTANKAYPVEELEAQRRKLPPTIFARRYLGQFTQLEGQVYPTFSAAVIEDPPPILPSPAVRVVGGIDWGWADPCAVLVGCECQDGVVYIVEEIYERHLPLDALAGKLKALQRKWNVETFFCDHSRPEIMHALNRHNIPCRRKTVNDIETGIAMVDARLRTGYLKVYANCTNLIDEAERYVRKTDKDGDQSEKPVDKNNHCADSCRYMISGLDRGRNLAFSHLPPQAEPEDEEEQTLVRLGKLSADPQERQGFRERQERELYNQWFTQMAYAGIDD